MSKKNKNKKPYYGHKDMKEVNNEEVVSENSNETLENQDEAVTENTNETLENQNLNVENANEEMFNDETNEENITAEDSNISNEVSNDCNPIETENDVHEDTINEEETNVLIENNNEESIDTDQESFENALNETNEENITAEDSNISNEVSNDCDPIETENDVHEDTINNEESIDIDQESFENALNETNEESITAEDSNISNEVSNDCDLIETENEIHEDTINEEESIDTDQESFENALNEPIKENVQGLPINTDQFIVSKYLKSSKKFSSKELLLLIEEDINKPDCDLSDLYTLIITSQKLNNNYELYGLLYYKTITNSLILNDKLIDDLKDKEMGAVLYYACKYAIANKDEANYKEILTRLKAIEGKSIYVTLLTYYHKFKVSTFLNDDKSYKIYKKMIRLLKSKGNKVFDQAFYALYLSAIESNANAFNENIKKCVKIYHKYEDKLDSEFKEYTLTIIGINYLMHYDFNEAKIIFNKILDFTSDSFYPYKYLMLINNKCRTIEDLIEAKNYDDLEEFKRIRNTALESKDPALIDRFNRFEDKLKQTKRNKLEEMFKSIRKSVITISLAFYALLFGIDYYIRIKALLGIIIALSVLLTLISFLRTDLKNIKKHLVPIITFGLIGIILLVLAIIIL